MQRYTFLSNQPNFSATFFFHLSAFNFQLSSLIQKRQEVGEHGDAVIQMSRFRQHVVHVSTCRAQAGKRPFSRICRSTFGRLPEQESDCYEYKDLQSEKKQLFLASKMLILIAAGFLLWQATKGRATNPAERRHSRCRPKQVVLEESRQWFRKSH